MYLNSLSGVLSKGKQAHVLFPSSHFSALGSQERTGFSAVMQGGCQMSQLLPWFVPLRELSKQCLE